MSGDNVSRIKERVDIVELIGGKVQLRRSGRNYKGLCPFHQEKTPSFYVYPDSQHYHCYGCGRSGDIFSFVMETESVDFRDALERMAGRAGIELQVASPRNVARDEHRDRLSELHDIAIGYFASMLWNSPAGAAAREMLERRGVDRTTAETFGLGYAPDSFDALKNHLQQRTGVAEQLLIEAGLLGVSDSGRAYDRFRNRLMFPIRDRDGRAIGFGARALGDEKPKYLNSPQTPLFDKSAALYAIDRAYDELRRGRTLVVVEGYMDALTAHQFGFGNVVASMGTALTEAQVGSIRRYVDRVYLALDSDAAGQIATLRGIETVRESFRDEVAEADPRGMVRFEQKIGAEILIVILPEGKDPDELIRRDPSLWTDALENAVPLVEYVLTTRLEQVGTTPAERSSALQEIALPLLREIRDPVIQRDYAALTARLLSYRDTDVLAALRQRSRSSGSLIAPRERPRQSDPELEIVSMLVRYPLTAAVRSGALFEIDLNDLYDARRRAIADAVISNEGNLIAALEELPEDFREYLEQLRDSGPRRDDLSPGMAEIELRQAIQSLGRLRYHQRLEQAQHDLDEARRSGDSELLQNAVRRMGELAKQKTRFDPGKSPYFLDSRTPTS
jgi:DNA primase